MSPNDVDPRMYTTVLREMIRHENDVTNHRIMWLLIGQGLIANAYVGATSASRTVAAALAGVGILITLSTYFILYKSYHARGYLEFLGLAAKAGRLPESLLPLMGWPNHRVKDWRKNVWVCAWLGKGTDLVEPYMFLPVLLILGWFVVLARQYLAIDAAWIVPVCVLATVILLGLLSILWVSRQLRDETESFEP